MATVDESTPRAVADKGNLSESHEVGHRTQSRSRLRSIRITQLLAFVFAIGFSSVITGIYPYLKELLPNETEEDLITKYGILVAINPLAQMLFSPVFGYATSKLGRVRPIFITANIMFICASLLYSLVSLAPEEFRYYLLLVSRFVVGASAANIVPVRTYVAGATFQSERTGELALIQGAQSLGFVIGPGIQTAFSPIGCSALASSGQPYFSMDTYTSCGWCTAFFGLVCLSLFLVPKAFEEHDVSNLEAAVTVSRAQPIDKGVDATNSSDGSSASIMTNVSTMLSAPDIIALVVIIVIFFILSFNFVFLEALGTPLCMDNFGWTEQSTVLYFGIIMAVNGLLSFALFASVGLATKRFDERKLMIGLGIFGYILSSVVVLPIPGMPSPHLKSNSSAASTSTTEMTSYRYLHYTHLQSRSELRPTSKQLYPLFDAIHRNSTHQSMLGIHNVQCEEATGQPGCDLEWCKYTPAVQFWQFLVSWFISDFAGAYSFAIAMGLFSKVIGPRPQGMWMGVFTSFSCLARGVGPILVSTTYRDYGTYAAFGLSIAAMILALVLASSAFKRLVPFGRGPHFKPKPTTSGDHEIEENTYL